MILTYFKKYSFKNNIYMTFMEETSFLFFISQPIPKLAIYIQIIIFILFCELLVPIFYYFNKYWLRSFWTYMLSMYSRCRDICKKFTEEILITLNLASYHFHIRVKDFSLLEQIIIVFCFISFPHNFYIKWTI